ncbi:DUF4224 domain-containing protein [Xylella fastidiosa subsp. multiplex]|uniref:DUF4224 domain-containing protein n=1 Tax=Xylella fastidiosa subsp. multiplex TaxID=644357 RepID=A0AAW6HW90_XYLFS|nr:DUF4224 domain-containing protein [Xylella fastidiosa]MDC6408717.1 DUF4224 domain-containing protein [Xylella fastidiosa subsp. multiplex]MDD0935981.1 DUF4224 domain-containing protein [Xylella fastidiosa subsp. multiplex]MSS68703.1 DUF4224 domain-containing protein [Xylella fastidiosa subsp. multiplex]
MNETEFLDGEELFEMTGYKNLAHQRDWLDRNGWVYVVNAAGRPIVGRWFARLRLAGVHPHKEGMSLHQGDRPNFAALD